MNHHYEPLSAEFEHRQAVFSAFHGSLTFQRRRYANCLRPRWSQKYGCFSFPHSDVLSFASSTASTISAAGFAAALQLCRRLETASLFEPAAATYEREMARIRGELLALFDLTSRPAPDVIFGASGTDVHLIAAQLLCHAGAPLFVIVAESSETGSGVPDALRGIHFSGRTALGEVVDSGRLMESRGVHKVAEVKGRLEDGDPRPVALVDEEVEAMAIKAIEAGRHVLLALTDVSKTGLVIPVRHVPWPWNAVSGEGRRTGRRLPDCVSPMRPSAPISNRISCGGYRLQNSSPGLQFSAAMLVPQRTRAAAAWVQCRPRCSPLFGPRRLAAFLAGALSPHRFGQL